MSPARGAPAGTHYPPRRTACLTRNPSQGTASLFSYDSHTIIIDEEVSYRNSTASQIQWRIIIDEEVSHRNSTASRISLTSGSNRRSVDSFRPFLT